VDVGICPIPSMMVVTKDKKAAGGIGVTASHNPPEWNGLKFISGKGLFLNPSEVEEFLDIYHQGEFIVVNVDRYKTPLSEKNPTDPHLDKLLGYLDVDTIQKKNFTVAADCCNGAGAVLMPRFLEALGCRPILINTTLDGTFAHCSEPVPENLSTLCRIVSEEKADVGFVQDADADRLAIVNEKGEPLGEELTLALSAQHILSKKRGPVVTNLSTTRAIDDIASRFKVPVFRTKIGEINVVEKILAEKAVIGGEGNGGVIFPEIHPCRDSFSAMGLILEAMAASGKTVSALRKDIPDYFMIKEKIECTPEQAYRVIRELKKRYSGKEKVSTLDGMKIDLPGSWIHIRPSNTEPILRIMTEAKSQREATDLLYTFKKEIKELLRWKSS
jgi:phosphomannomutase